MGEALKGTDPYCDDSYGNRAYLDQYLLRHPSYGGQ
jgi:hypothetical protein